MSSFGKAYAQLYDAIYESKDYRAESDFLKGLFLEHGGHLPNTLLDFGCGTGRHSRLLAQDGIAVTGFDPSAEMLEIARERAQKENLSIHFVPELPSQGRFDAAVMMFAVLNYLPNKAAVGKAFRQLHELLSPQGLLVIETWNAAAVPFLSEPKREKRLQIGSVEWRRQTDCEVDWKNQVAHIRFQLSPSAPSGESFSEYHPMSYYTYREFTELFTAAGFELLAHLPAFESRDVRLDDFSVLYVAGRR